MTDQAAKARTRKWLLTVAQVVLTLGAFGYLLTITDVSALAAAFRKSPAYCIPAVIATMFFILYTSALRWRLLFSAYGASAPPRVLVLFRLQLIGLFYNMLPGAVGGDVIRGVVSRDAFGERGLGAGLAVVFIDRLIGLIGLLLLVLAMLSLHSIPALHLPPLFLVAGLVGSLCAIGVLAVGRRLASVLPGKLGLLAASLPTLERPSAFALAVMLAVVNQGLTGVIGHITIAPLAPDVQLADSMVLAPISFAAIFFPFTVAGAGTRDAAMIALYGLVGVSAAVALSASLEILISYLVIAAVGGALAAMTPLRGNAATRADG